MLRLASRRVAFQTRLGVPLRMRPVVGAARLVLAARFHLRSAEVLGPRVRLRGRPVVENYGHLRVAERVQFVSTVAKIELATGSCGTLEIGPRTFINYGTSISASRLVRIGASCHIGTYVIILDNDFHRLEPERRLERPESRPVIIEDNVWLGARVIVLPGVTIGEGSAVAAGSVVTRDIPARSLAAGIPAKVIRTL